jgi:hypothetical protein
MLYELTVRDHPTHLHFKVTGRNSYETVRRYLFEIYTICVKRNCSAVLIEENLEGPGLALAEIYNIVAEGSQRKGLPVHRVAYVDINPEHSSANMEFAQSVAVNRGLEVQVFATVAEAEKWLHSGSGQ